MSYFLNMVLQKADLKMIAAETGISGSGLAMCPYDPDDNATYIYIGKNTISFTLGLTKLLKPTFTQYPDIHTNYS